MNKDMVWQAWKYIVYPCLEKLKKSTKNNIDDFIVELINKCNDRDWETKVVLFLFPIFLRIL